MRQQFTTSSDEHIHCTGCKSCVRFFFDKEASNNNPGGLILCEGHSDYFIITLNEILFLKAAFPRPLHPNDREGPEVEVTPMQGMWFGTTDGWNRSKKDRLSTNLVPTKCALKLKHSSKSFNERQVKKYGRCATPTSISTCLVYSPLLDLISGHRSLLCHTVLGDCSRRKLPLSGAGVSLRWVQVPLERRRQTLKTPLKASQDLGQLTVVGQPQHPHLRALSRGSGLSLSSCSTPTGRLWTKKHFTGSTARGHRRLPQSLASGTARPYFSNLKQKDKNLA